MSWMQQLYETYERCDGLPQFSQSPLMPVGHGQQQAHIEIVLDGEGSFLRASVLNRENTIVPVTENSAGRTTRPEPHPLCDKIQYCAADYEQFGGDKEPAFKQYIQQLREWQARQPVPKVQAVLKYVEKGGVVADLCRSQILHCGPDGRLLTAWSDDTLPPLLFKTLTPKEGKRDQGDAFVRWRVQIPGDPISAVWEDPAVQVSWIQFLASQEQARGLCMVTGGQVSLANNHPKRLRHGADGAKLLSSNDTSGYTFRGRFETAEQAYGVGSIASQKAHNALRWLIDRQGRKGDQVFVAWDVGGKDIPDPLKNTADLDPFLSADEAAQIQLNDPGDAGQHFALRLERMISGYRANLSDSDNIVVMGLDSATPGRMAITYYRELTGSEFLDRVLNWHERYSWPQNYAKDKRFEGAPAPDEIAEATYGRRVDAKLRKSTVERLLPCIIDARPLPRDLIHNVVRRAASREGWDKDWEWEKCLGIACALVRGSSKENYKMALEEDRTSRDYLYGRLLALAENIEKHALYVANEARGTNAERLMQRFASHPYSTWRNLELALAPYKTRLRTNRPGLLQKRETLLDTVLGMFRPEDFISDATLSGEFLLGYHCQRSALWNKTITEGSTEESEEKE